MRLVLAITLRVIWLMVVYVIAVYAAAATVTLAASSIWYAPAHGDVETTAMLFEMALVVGVSGAFFGHAFFAPGLLGIAIAEIFRIRSALANLVGGVAAAVYAGNYTPVLAQSHISYARAWELLLASGVVAGAVYWLLAGRNAGRWKDDEIAARRSPENPTEPSS